MHPTTARWCLTSLRSLNIVFKDTFMKFRDPTKSMWTHALEMLEQADRLHRQFFQLGKVQSRVPSWEPPVDIFETGQELSILTALPGVSPSEVQVIIDGGALCIVGERPMPACAGALIRRLEIPYGHFERRIDLPPGHFEISERVLTNGCLLLTLKKLG